MKSVIKRITCFLLCFVMTVTAVNSLAFVSFADTKEETKLKNDIASLKAQASEIQKDIDRLKAQKADQGVILKAAQRKVANTQAQITRCNNEINSIGSPVVYSVNVAEVGAVLCNFKDGVFLQKDNNACFSENRIWECLCGSVREDPDADGICSYVCYRDFNQSALGRDVNMNLGCVRQVFACGGLERKRYSRGVFCT